MKKTLSVLLMLMVALSVLPMALAEEDNTSSNNTETNDDNGSHDSSEEIKLKAKIENNQTKVETEVNGTEEEFTLETTDLETIKTEIMTRTGLSREQVEANLKVKRSDEIVNDEVEAMDNEHGASVRLLQLEKAIARNILHGKEIVKDVDNSTELEAILTEMEALKTEVHNTDPKATDAVKNYVTLRHDANELSKKFRDAARAMLKDKVKEVKEKLKKLKNDSKDLDEKIAKERKAFNSQRMVMLAAVMKITEGDLLTKIESGELTAQEAKDLLVQRIKDMSPEELRESLAKLKEERIKSKVEAKTKADESRKKEHDTKEERVKERLQKLEEQGKKMNEYAAKRLEKLKEEAEDKDSEKQTEKEDEE